MNAITALKLAIEFWDGVSGCDSQCGDVVESGMYAARFNGPFRADEILEAIGEECGPLEGIDTLVDVVGAIYNVNDIGQKSITIYTDKRALENDWVGFEDELRPMDYTINGGNRVAVYAGSGRSVAFLQDEDGSRLADELEACQTDEEIQAILSSYMDN